MLRFRWYEYIREVLKHWEDKKLVHDSCRDGDIRDLKIQDGNEYDGTPKDA